MSVDLSKLPSLDLVRGFVAVGRRMSITQAARDLFLTQSAVSRQVHALEEFLGVRLLVRGHRNIAFTPEGERLFRSADGAIQQLQYVVAELRMTGRLRPVTISAATGLIMLWLLPRMGRLQAAHPDIDVRISANNQMQDLRNEGIDLAIRYAGAHQVPPGSIRLFGESLAPVAAPSLGIGAMRSGAVLARHTLLEFDEPRAPWLHWKDWLAGNGLPDARPAHFLRFNQYDMVIQAAIAGQGIALGRRALVQHLVDEGKLVWLAEPQAPARKAHSYWLLRAEASQRADVNAVADWIVGEVGVQSTSG
jgi:LysR family glycine cleavage system transcriptional activator